MRQFRIRLAFIMSLLIAAGGTVVYRLFTVQVLDCERYRQRSREQTNLRQIVPARRGSLVDRFGRTLAVSINTPISVEPAVLGIDNKQLSKNSTNLKRVYPLGDIGGSLLGYIGTDGHGLDGAELAFDMFLRGEDGWSILQKDGRNYRYKKIGLPEKLPRDGFDVALTIDINIQKIAQTALRKAVHELRAKGGMCIVMDPWSGAILAMADEPSFNPNIPGSSSLKVRRNRCISSLIEPGSTFKLVTASIALQEKFKNENDLIFGDNGSYRIYDQIIRDHTPFGYLTFTKAFAYSSNVCFVKVAADIDNEKFYRYVRDFGFGSKTGIDLPGEECGIVHSVKSWSGRTRLTMAIGQEISSTLLQMMLPYAAVANGGVLLTPRVFDRVVDREGNVIDSGTYKPIRRVFSEETASRLRLMLKEVVDNGTGKQASIQNLPIGGKTGTGQKPDSGGYSKTRVWSSFIGFVPVNTPQLLCGIVIDEPAGGEMGGAAAAPVFRNIIMQILSHPELEFAEKILRSDSSRIVRPKGDGYISDQRKSTVTYNHSGMDDDSRGVLPDCIGKDLRDAVNSVICRGFRPVTVGFGKVRRQVPQAGTKRTSAAACTLYCSLDG